jgi:hypothetical protein
MNKRFLLTDQGELEYYLGFEVSEIDQTTLLLHQTAYAKKILERFKVTERKPVTTPLPRDLNLSLMDSPDDVNVEFNVRKIWHDSRHESKKLLYCMD